MQFEASVLKVEAEPVTLSGAVLMVVEVGGRAHCVPKEVFDLFYTTEHGMGEVAAPPVLARVAVEKNGKRMPRMPRQPVASIALDAPARKQLDEYLEALRYPLAVKLRMVYDTLLAQGPMTGGELAEKIGGTETAVFGSLYSLQNKKLAKKRVDGAWELEAQ